MDLLVGVSELADLLAQADPPALLDVRWSPAGPTGREAYDGGHLPGAQFVDLDTDLAAPAGVGGRHPLPAPRDFVTAMRSHGVDRDGAVVVYDQNDSTIAARAWWLLRHYGHPDVRVLDGGFDAWDAAGLAVQLDVTPARTGDFDGAPGASPVLDVDEVRAFGAAEVLLDARAAARYRGDVEPLDPVAGHIPGALSMPTAQNVRADGTWRHVDELRARFDPVVAGAVRVGVYCGSGVTAAHQVLALELAGVEAALYPGSWSEWIADPTRPTVPGTQDRT